jgi:hypothetical protein
MRSALIFVAFAVSVVLGITKFWSERTQAHPPGITAPDIPWQKNLESTLEFARFDHRIVARAEFDITARVLERMRYRHDDFARVSPVDFAMGWGEMSDTAILERMSCSQGSRFYACSWKSADVIDPRRFTALSANMHMIPATADVEEALLRVRKGQVVMVRGYLVDVIPPGGGGAWRTSLTREDSGPGGCEIIWVTGVSAS